MSVCCANRPLDDLDGGFFFPGSRVDVKTDGLALKAMAGGDPAQEWTLERPLDHHFVRPDRQCCGQQRFGGEIVPVQKLQQAQVLFDLGALGSLWKHRVQVNHRRLFVQLRQEFKTVADKKADAGKNRLQAGQMAGTPQAVVQQGRHHGVGLDHHHPESMGCQQEAVPPQSGGGIDEQRVVDTPDPGRPDQQFPGAGTASALGMGVGKVHPQGARKIGVSQGAEFQPLLRETHQRTFCRRRIDTAEPKVTGQGFRPKQRCSRCSPQGNSDGALRHAFDDNPMVFLLIAF